MAKRERVKQKTTNNETASPSASLEKLAKDALNVAKTARRHRNSLKGDNFYGNKFASLRSDATIQLAALSRHSVDDTSDLAELIDTCFSPDTKSSDRLDAFRELSHLLRTKWVGTTEAKPPGNELFPFALIAKANRGYLTTIAKQMNGCRREGWLDACAVMMRRLIEIAIIEAFEKKGIAAKIKDANDDYFQLTALIDRALNEPKFALSRNAKSALPKLKTVGHMSAHGRYFTAQPSDIDKLETGLRVVVEEFLRHAELI
ncbi:hypothetical protein ACQR16_17195 [Bradyrhizobium oligotrophicum]|uniref:hypothetical protein n=1 Tax=Bradyrhizobium oligotrophicum TaxID=44255 RepID=UPI003EBB0253